MRSLFISSVFLGLLAVFACASTEDNSGNGSSEDDIKKYKPKEVENFPTDYSINGFSLGGYEYWPFKEEQPIYPDKVKWGYESGSAPAKKCMAAAKTALIEILKDPPAELLELKAKTGISSFFQWNNDYTDAASNAMQSSGMRVLWLYNGRLMKWISETNKNGTCLIPERKDLRALARDCLKNLAANSGGTLYCSAANTRGLPPEPPRDAGTDAR